MGLLREKISIFFTEKQYSDIYSYFIRQSRPMENLEIMDLFLLAAVIGFKNSKKRPLKDRKGTQTRGSFLKRDQESLIYNMAFSDKDFTRSVEKLSSDDEEVIKEIRTLIEEYANAGMDILVEKVFKDNWVGTELSRDYDKYYFELSKYIIAEIQDVPF